MSFALRALLNFSGRLPLRLLHALAAGLGALLWRLPNKPRRLTLWHLERCLPELDEATRQRVARESLTHMMQAVLEAPTFWFGGERRLRAWLTDAQAAQQLQALLAQQHGVIWLCPHLGAWELAGLFCSANGPMSSLYKPQKGALDALMREGRERLGAQLVPTSAGGVKALLAALKRREMIGILPDHDPPPGSGVFAPLFGHAAHTTELVSKLAARSGAPVWFCIAERLPRAAGYRLHLLPAPAAVSDPEQGVAALNAAVEDVIRRWPQQYWWAYRRYRRQPAGAEPFYRQLDARN
ncbi:KDO2-lipid IV(A) lauroyltransferase [Solimonas aquatica]|uniref:KDO2-lipid IV(A) lauroyltransferase n=1 Tax=Solimonas aquatica TaxID=489703 RepID=A0A1H9EM94_9GAMM|nr:lysophospholipid acyltransferase family protein [Solimonas aquatica]SEQ26850.1 KDO2-lipid IV(A) lauroyltransferase [Solimonas aquatica]